MTTSTGEHVEELSSIPPRSYDFKKKISCPHCIALIEEFRANLCEKYGWSKWPDDLKGALQGES